MIDADPVAVTWGLFVFLEDVEEAGRDLPDPEVDAFFEAAATSWRPGRSLFVMQPAPRRRRGTRNHEGPR